MKPRVVHARNGWWWTQTGRSWAVFRDWREAVDHALTYAANPQVNALPAPAGDNPTPKENRDRQP